MVRGAVYIRVSTEDQMEFSPDAQKSELFKYADKHEITILDEHIYMDEGISGREASKRPAFMRMIGGAKKKPRPFDVILVHRFDRFARNREDSIIYKSVLRKECGIKVISITEQFEDNKFAIILESMLEAMAEYYSINLADEVMKGMIEKAKRGGIQQTVPLGYEVVNNEAVINQLDAEAVTYMFNQYSHKGASYIEIARNLNAMGYKSKRGNLFTSRAVKRILENRFYIGDILWNRRDGHGRLKDEASWISAKGSYPLFIEEDVFEKTQKRMMCSKQIRGGNRKPSTSCKHYLSGLLVCKHCGAKMVYRQYSQGKYKYFYCNKSKIGACNHSKLIRTQKLEKAILTRITKDLNNIALTAFDEGNNIEPEVKVLKSRLAQVQRESKQARKAYLAEIDSLEEYEESKKRYTSEERNIQNKLDTLKSKQKRLKSVYIIDQIEDVMNLDFLDTIQKNKILKSFIKAVIVDVDRDELMIEYYIGEEELIFPNLL